MQQVRNSTGRLKMWAAAYAVDVLIIIAIFLVGASAGLLVMFTVSWCFIQVGLWWHAFGLLIFLSALLLGHYCVAPRK